MNDARCASYGECNGVALAITGASGIVYATRLLQCLLAAQQPVALVMSKPAQMVLRMETQLNWPSRPQDLRTSIIAEYGCAAELIQVYGRDDWLAPIASGSNPPKAMVICPCSMGTLAAVAQGLSQSLIHRAADVVLKEQGKLIIVPRETPLTTIHLQHMLSLAKLNAIIMPANPGFYLGANAINDLVDFMVARILDHLDIKHDLIKRWGETQ